MKCFKKILLLLQNELKTCKINVPVNEKTSKCKGFAFPLVLKHVQKEFVKQNGITLGKELLLWKMKREKEINKICRNILNVPL